MENTDRLLKMNERTNEGMLCQKKMSKLKPGFQANVADRDQSICQGCSTLSHLL